MPSSLPSSLPLLLPRLPPPAPPPTSPPPPLPPRPFPPNPPPPRLHSVACGCRFGVQIPGLPSPVLHSPVCHPQSDRISVALAREPLRPGYQDPQTPTRLQGMPLCPASVPISFMHEGLSTASCLCQCRTGLTAVSSLLLEPTNFAHLWLGAKQQLLSSLHSGLLHVVTVCCTSGGLCTGLSRPASF